MRILILGASGMIGSALFKRLSSVSNLELYGGVRDLSIQKYFSASLQDRLVNCGDLAVNESIHSILKKINPDVVINCAGLTKHKKEADDPVIAMPINASMPHQFASACDDRGIRFIHRSSDCVFSGAKGGYVEDD